MTKHGTDDAAWKRLQAASLSSRRRAARARAKAMGRWIPVISAVMAAALVWVFVRDFQAKQALRTRGVAAVATVDAYYRPCPATRRTCASRIAYSFRIPAGRFAGQVFRVDTTDGVPAWPSARVGLSAPIVFDPRNPRLSALNFDNAVFTTDPTGALSFGIGLSVTIFVFMSGLVLLGNALLRQQERAEAPQER